MFQRQKSDTKLRRTPSFFTEARHLAEPVEVQPSQEWRVKSTRTHGGVLAVCLNAEVEPPDCVFPRALRTGAGRLLCGIDPLGASQAEQRKVVGRIGRQLELQYEQLHGSRSTVFKQCLDPTVEALHRACRRQRREARDEALLFHFCGHGVPAPSELGEIWLFNDSYTEYVPVRAEDVAEWLGGPSLFVLDCPCAGRLVRALARRGADAATAGGAAAAAAAPVVLGATAADERLPVSRDFPADVFTACLTRPLETALQLAMRSSLRRAAGGPPPPAAQLLAALPGSLGDRRSPLGELTWVLTAITDSIAWQLLPPALFRRLFRQDVLLSALLRNFVLASRVMHTLHCSVVSHPPLPPMHDHPLWEVWDHTVDLCLAQRPPAPYSLTPFFTEQLSAFEHAVAHAAACPPAPGDRGERRPLQQLPVLLQALLSQSHRVRALLLLRRFLSLGGWAVQQALNVGIFQYVAKLLHSSAAELRPLLLHVWAAVLAFDRSCQVECLKANGHLYFLHILLNPPAATSPASASPPQPRPDDDATAVAAAAAAAGGRPARRRRRPRRSLRLGNGAGLRRRRRQRGHCRRPQGSSFDRGERDSGGGEGEGHETVGSKATALLVLSALCDGHRAAQAACFEAGLLPHCARAMHDDEPVMQCWAALCLAKLVQTNASIATAALALPGFASRQATLIGHRVVEVRAAAVHLQGEIVRALGGVDADAPAAPAAAPSAAAGAPAGAVEAAAAIDSLAAVRRLRLTCSLLAVLGDASPLVRAELLVAISSHSARSRRSSPPPGSNRRRRRPPSRAAPPSAPPARRCCRGRRRSPRRAGRSPLSLRPTEAAAAAAAAAVAPWAPAPWARRSHGRLTPPAVATRPTSAVAVAPRASVL